MYDKGLLFEYTRVRAGYENPEHKKKITFTKDYFGSDCGTSEQNAIKVFKMACEIFLRWSPIDVKERMNKDIISMMGLEKPYKFFPFPPYLDKSIDYWYIAHALYPKELPFDGSRIAIDVYKKVLDGKYYKFPKKFFDSADGRERAGACLRYYIEQFEVFHSIEDMYKYFSSPEGIRALSEHGLRLVWSQVFGSPVSFLHESLDPDQRDEFLYHLYEFRYQYEQQQKQLKRFEQELSSKEAATVISEEEQADN